MFYCQYTVKTMAYRFIEHTSDIIIESENKDFASALTDMAMGMFTQMGKTRSVAAKISAEANATSKEELVVSFLSEILAQCEIELLIPNKIKITSCSGSSISAVIYGEKKPPENIIKAVTYHELSIEEKSGYCKIRVLFDI